MKDDFGPPGSSFADRCVGLFVGGMALYGFVWIIKSIWIWLCVIAFVGAIAALGVWLLARHLRRW